MTYILMPHNLAIPYYCIKFHFCTKMVILKQTLNEDWTDKVNRQNSKQMTHSAVKLVLKHSREILTVRLGHIFEKHVGCEKLSQNKKLQFNIISSHFLLINLLCYEYSVHMILHVGSNQFFLSPNMLQKSQLQNCKPLALGRVCKKEQNVLNAGDR